MEGLAIRILKLKLKEVTTKLMKKTLQLRGNSVGPFGAISCINVKFKASVLRIALSLIPEPELEPHFQIFTTLLTKVGYMMSNKINFRLVSL
jgi:hypothetical protein